MPDSTRRVPTSSDRRQSRCTVGSRYSSTLDLVSGYWKMPLDAGAQEKSAFAFAFGSGRCYPSV